MNCVIYRETYEKAHRILNHIRIGKRECLQEITPLLNLLPAGDRWAKGGAYFMAALKTKDPEWFEQVLNAMLKTGDWAIFSQAILNLNTNINVKKETYLPIKYIESHLFQILPSEVWNKNTIRVLLKNERYDLVQQINQKYPLNFSGWTFSHKNIHSGKYDIQLSRLNAPEKKTLGLVSWCMMNMDGMGLQSIKKWLTTHYIFNEFDEQWMECVSMKIGKTNHFLAQERISWISALERQRLLNKHHIQKTLTVEAL